MRYVLDTHVFLWWVADDPRLSDRARTILGSAANLIYFSAVSAWEIAIKAGLGRLDTEGDIALFVTEQITANRFTTLAVSVRHALHVSSLPLLHRDPFDRLLVAQAATEGLTLLSADPFVRQYVVSTLW